MDTQHNSTSAELDEDAIFAQVAKEIVQKEIDEGLWTKAFAIENGDERKTKAHYIRLRVEQLKTTQSTTQQEKAQDTSEHSRNEQDYIVESSNKAKALAFVPATAWQRFWARSIDLLICTILVQFIPIRDELLFNIWLVVIVGFLLTGVVLVIYDGLLTSVFGATIGKMIAGIRVQKLDGSYPDFGLALRRAYNVLVSGNWIYMGYPILQLLLWPRLHKEFKKTGTTSWDGKASTEVIRISNNEFRRLLAGALGVLCFISTLLVFQAIKQLNKKVILEQVSVTQSAIPIPIEKQGVTTDLFEEFLIGGWKCVTPANLSYFVQYRRDGTYIRDISRSGSEWSSKGTWKIEESVILVSRTEENIVTRGRLSWENQGSVMKIVNAIDNNTLESCSKTQLSF